MQSIKIGTRIAPATYYMSDEHHQLLYTLDEGIDLPEDQNLDPSEAIKALQDMLTDQAHDLFFPDDVVSFLQRNVFLREQEIAILEVDGHVEEQRWLMYDHGMYHDLHSYITHLGRNYALMCLFLTHDEEHITKLAPVSCPLIVYLIERGEQNGFLSLLLPTGEILTRSTLKLEKLLV